MILVTTLLTVVSGTVVYVLGRIAEKFVLDPIRELRRAICDVQVSLTFFADVYSGQMAAMERRREACKAFRNKPAKFSASPLRSPVIPIWRVGVGYPTGES